MRKFLEGNVDAEVQEMAWDEGKLSCLVWLDSGSWKQSLEERNAGETGLGSVSKALVDGQEILVYLYEPQRMVLSKTITCSELPLGEPKEFCRGLNT